MTQSTLYHASNSEIIQPDWAKFITKSYFDHQGSRALGFFSVVDPDGCEMYGDRLYAFTLSDAAVVMDAPDWFRDNCRCSAFYVGLRECALHLGYHALRINHCVIVLDMTVIEGWAEVEWPNKTKQKDC